MLGVICCAVLAGHVQAQIPLRLGEPELIEASLMLGRPIDVSLGYDGSAYVADLANHVVIRFSADGELMWQSGRRGRGPGEYVVPYRVAPLPNGGALVYDQGLREITTLDANGEYVVRRSLPIGFIFVDKVVALRDGRVIITGITLQPGASDHSLHVFGPDLAYQESFGPLPETGSDVVLENWGAGGLTVARNGDLIFSVRIPYSIHRFSDDGTELVSVAPMDLESTPDEAVSVDRTTTGVRFQIQQENVMLPGSAFDLGDGWLVVGRRKGQHRMLDFVSPEGEISQTIPVPSGIRYIAGIDYRRDLILARGVENDVPALYRIPIDRGR